MSFLGCEGEGGICNRGKRSRDRDGLTWRYLPEGIADDEKGDVDFVGVAQDVVGLRFDHFTVGNNHVAAIEGFLFMPGAP